MQHGGGEGGVPNGGWKGAEIWTVLTPLHAAGKTKYVHLPSSAFVQKKHPAHIKEFREKAGGRVWLVCVCLRVSTHTGAGRQREDEALSLRGAKTTRSS